MAYANLGSWELNAVVAVRAAARAGNEHSGIEHLAGVAGILEGGLEAKAIVLLRAAISQAHITCLGMRVVHPANRQVAGWKVGAQGNTGRAGGWCGQVRLGWRIAAAQIVVADQEHLGICFHRIHPNEIARV